MCRMDDGVALLSFTHACIPAPALRQELTPQVRRAIMWSYRLAILSLVLTLLVAGSAIWEPLIQAEFLAKALAPRIGTDEAILRRHLVAVLGAYPFRRAFVFCSPWAFLTIVFAARAMRNLAQERKKRTAATRVSGTDIDR